MKNIDPVGMNSRALQSIRKRGRFVVKGPNRVWSVDGHDKLSEFGFQIYGIIDAYSRRILSLYIGVSNRTAVSIQKQYLEAVQEHGYPKLVRSDKGGETILMAECQLAFRRAEKPDLPFHKAYSFGTSTKNQRIEAWWNIMANSQTEQYKRCFEEYKGAGLFDGGTIDQTALRYIYMEHIRGQIHNFVMLHNAHPIRKQKNRDHYLPTGRPNYMYKYPPFGTRNYATPATEELLQQKIEEVASYSLDEYLPQATRELCDSLLAERGYSTPLLIDLQSTNQLHKEVYHHLRNDLTLWQQVNGPISTTQPPLGAHD